MISRKITINTVVPSFLLLLLTPASKGIAGQQIEHNVPQGLSQAVDVGPVRPEKEINLTIQIKLPNQAAFDQAVEQLYNPGSPTYQKWLTDADLQKYAPSAAQVAVVKNELQKHGLSIISVDPLGFSIRVHGTVANVESAFQTRLHEFSLKNRTFTANIEDARLTGDAGNLVEGVSGLVSQNVRPMIQQAMNPVTGKGYTAMPLSQVEASGGLGSIFSVDCFSGPRTFTFNTPGQSLPTAVYFGNVYSPSKPCAFLPAQLQHHYGLPAAYSKGLDGAGQSIVLLEAYGYPTALEDANTFSKLTGLPELNSSNFEVVYPEGPPKNPNLGVLTGWYIEIALDIQWAHSIAPKAKIIVAASAGQDNEDFQDAMNYIANHQLGFSVNDSWEEDLDLIAGPLEIASYNSVLARAAAKGVSFNFSSGDSGDEGLGTPMGAPGVPSESPYATAVGGTSILHNLNGMGTVEVGWGTALTLVNYYGPFDPPAEIGFIGGSGGGESVNIPKPSWQKGLPGTGRQVPDVSALADPYTGVPIVITMSGQQYVSGPWGGTSLACPIFSAFWTLAVQSAGHPLGQAAPRIAKLSPAEVTDIVPHTSPFNVAGTIFDSNGPTYYSPSDLLSNALYNQTEFVSAVWPISNDFDYVIGFNLDSSLTVTPGWDNVTGFGVPNGLAFIEGAGK